jgi:hypothetical protein
LGKPLRLNLRKHLPRILGCAAGLVGVLCSPSNAPAQEPPPPQGVSRGENFSAKPPAQLFQSDCTGSGCHKSPQGLARSQGFGGLAGFLREHYTNSRESAAALASYLSKLPSGPEPRESRTSRGKPAAASTASRGPESESKPSAEERTSRHRSRPGATPDEEPATAAHHLPAEPAETAAKPDAKPESKPEAKPESKPEPKPSARERRGRQPATAAAEPPTRAEPETATAPPPSPPPHPAPPAPSAAPKQYDIFD